LVCWAGNHLGKDGEVLGRSSPGRKEKTSAGRRTGVGRGALKAGTSGEWYVGSAWDEQCEIQSEASLKHEYL